MGQIKSKVSVALPKKAKEEKKESCVHTSEGTEQIPQESDSTNRSPEPPENVAAAVGISQIVLEESEPHVCATESTSQSTDKDVPPKPSETTNVEEKASRPDDELKKSTVSDENGTCSKVPDDSNKFKPNESEVTSITEKDKTNTKEIKEKRSPRAEPNEQDKNRSTEETEDDSKTKKEIKNEERMNTESDDQDEDDVKEDIKMQRSSSSSIEFGAKGSGDEYEITECRKSSTPSAVSSTSIPSPSERPVSISQLSEPERTVPLPREMGSRDPDAELKRLTSASI